MGSSGGGSGGGGATAPMWLQEVHWNWLNRKGADTLAYSFATDMVTAHGANPYSGLVAYVPDTYIVAMQNAVTEVEVLVDAMNYHTDFDAVYTNAASIVDTIILPAAHITALVDAHTTDLMSEYTNKLLPAFDAGMRDVGGIHTSAFILGRANILANITDKVATFRAELEMQSDAKRGDLINQATSEMLRLMVQKIEFKRTWAAMTADILRIAIAAKGDQFTENKLITVSSRKWPLEIWQYGSNLMAGATGGTVAPGKAEGNQMARIIGGGLSGASAGALIGSRIGGEGSNSSIGGALLGGIAGMLGGSMS